MASVAIRTEVCDTCRKLDRPIFKRVRIAPEGERLRTVAFCEEDYAPMKTVLKNIEASWPKQDGRRSRKVTIDQIERMKGGTGTRKRTAKVATATRGPKKAALAAAQG